MHCLRCNKEMKHYRLDLNTNIYGAEHKPTPFSAIITIPHNIHSVYICDECGYAELSTHVCENPDI